MLAYFKYAYLKYIILIYTHNPTLSDILEKSIRSIFRIITDYQVIPTPLAAPKLKLLFNLFRSIYEASQAPEPAEQFAHVTEAIGHVSDVTAQNTFRIGALESSKRVKDCEAFEEKEGRINTDLLNRLIIVGGPLIQPGQNMQDQLMKQVYILCYPLLFPSQLVCLK